MVQRSASGFGDGGARASFGARQQLRQQQVCLCSAAAAGWARGHERLSDIAAGFGIALPQVQARKGEHCSFIWRGRWA